MVVYPGIAFTYHRTAVALGLFDGIHLGHRAVIDRAVAQKENGLSPAVMTFSIDRSAPETKQGMKRLMTDRLRLKRLESIGVEIVMMPAFERIKEFSPEEFVDTVLVKHLHAKLVVCGEDYRFGKKAAGDVNLLRSLCAGYGIEMVTVPKVLADGEPISSTRIRSLLLEGETEAANKLLGYFYSFDFEVAHGLEVGRTIGIPTINQIFPEQFLIPKFGVYASYTYLGGKRYRSITNVGIKPTIAGQRFPLAETHIFGINSNLYGQHVSVSLVSFIRPERKFETVAELSEEIHANIEQVKKLLPD